MIAILFIAAIAFAAAATLSLRASSACAVVRRDLLHLRESFESLLAMQRTEWMGEIAKLRLEEAEVNHTERRQVMQMFRSGISPDTAAVKLGLPKREMRLAAKVFGTLAR